MPKLVTTGYGGREGYDRTSVEIRGAAHRYPRKFGQIMHILITGAAGSGTSTLAEAVSDATQSQFLEADEYLWYQSNPPYQHKRDEFERTAGLLKDLRARQHSVVAGSLVGWGQELEDAFDLVVFLYLPSEIRIARLKKREERLFGKANPEFLAWAAQYETGTAGGRSLERHRQWLKLRKCPVIYLEGDLSTEVQLQRVFAACLDIR